MTIHKDENKIEPAIRGPFTGKADPAYDAAQARTDAECKHPPTPHLRRDEQMHPYGLN
jgi:hypothetical protein